MKFYAFTNQHNEYFKLFLKSCERNNIDINVFGEGFNEKPLMITRFSLWLKHLEKLPKNEIVLFSDCWDVFYLRSEKTILNNFLSTGYRILFSVELKPTHHFQHNIEYFTKQKKPNTPYSFVNAGSFMGYNKDIQLMIKYLLSKDMWALGKKYSKPNTNDQTVFGDFCRKGQKKVGLDYYCKIFWNIAFQWDISKDIEVKDGKLYNPFTNNYPCMIHIPWLERNHKHVKIVAEKLKLC